MIVTRLREFWFNWYLHLHLFKNDLHTIFNFIRKLIRCLHETHHEITENKSISYTVVVFVNIFLHHFALFLYIFFFFFCVLECLTTIHNTIKILTEKQVLPGLINEALFKINFKFWCYLKKKKYIDVIFIR